MAEATTDTDLEETPRRRRDRATETAKAARERASETARRARERASLAAEAARERGRRAVDSTSAGVADNPLAAIAGGVVIGALIAGLLPRTKPEDRLAGDVGRKVRAQARKTVTNVRQNAKDQLDELGLTADNAKDQLKGLASKFGQVASDAAGGSKKQK